VAKPQPSADIPILVPDQAVVGDYVGVEIDLQLGIEGNYLRGGSQIFNKEFPGFIEIIYVGVIAVAVVGESLHHDIIQVATTTD
jgi:hypothetical protein